MPRISLKKKTFHKIKSVKILVWGKVQGVFYRASTKSKADSLNLIGFVKNEPDGTVLINASGESHNIKKLIEWCWKGSEFSKVEKVEVQDLENFPDKHGFEIRR